MRNLKKIRKSFVTGKKHPSAILSLMSIVRYHGGIVYPKFLTDESKTIDGVTKLSHLVNAANAVGLVTKAVRSNIENLKIIINPVILFVTNDQGKEDYIVCYGYDRRFLVGVPGWSLTQFSDEEMMSVWESKIMLYLEPIDSFKKTFHISNHISACRPQSRFREWLEKFKYILRKIIKF